MALRHFDGCFVCGKANSRGLKANFVIQDGEVTGEFVPSQDHQGPKNLLHGGIICALLDEAMAALINGVLGTDAPTVFLEVRFKKPARINEKLLIKAQLINHERRVKYAQATLEKEDGTVIATGKGKFLTNFKLA